MRQNTDRLRRFMLAGVGAFALAIASAGAADAALVFAGSWRVGDGPADFVQQSAQTVAASLFGGAAADYIVSNDFSNPNSRQAWYVYETIPATVLVTADDATVYNAFFGDTPISAYWGEPIFAAFNADAYTNYAWREVTCTDNTRVCQGGGGVPEPGTWALMLCGFGFAGAMLRRRAGHFA